MDGIGIVLAEPHFLAREGLKKLIEEDAQLRLIGEAQDSSGLTEAVSRLQPRVVIFDYFNTEVFEAEDTGRIRAAGPETGILIITQDNRPEFIFKCISAGAHSFLTKDCSKDEILSAIRATARQEKFFCNRVLDMILENKESAEDCRPTNLSNREQEVLTLIAEGHSGKEIAERLCLSTHTVYTHRKNIMRKLKAKSGSELVRYAVSAGLV